MVNKNKGNIILFKKHTRSKILSVALTSSLIAAAVVIPLLCELPLSIYAQSNLGSIPFLPPLSTDGTTSSEKSALITNNTPSTSTQQKSDEGALTIKQVLVGTDKLLPSSKFKITPNPSTLRGSYYF